MQSVRGAYNINNYYIMTIVIASYFTSKKLVVVQVRNTIHNLPTRNILSYKTIVNNC